MTATVRTQCRGLPFFFSRIVFFIRASSKQLQSPTDRQVDRQPVNSMHVDKRRRPKPLCSSISICLGRKQCKV